MHFRALKPEVLHFVMYCHTGLKSGQICGNSRSPWIPRGASREVFRRSSHDWSQKSPLALYGTPAHRPRAGRPGNPWTSGSLLLSYIVGSTEAKLSKDDEGNGRNADAVDELRCGRCAIHTLCVAAKVFGTGLRCACRAQTRRQPCPCDESLGSCWPLEAPRKAVRFL